MTDFTSSDLTVRIQAIVWCVFIKLYCSNLSIFWFILSDLTANSIVFLAFFGCLNSTIWLIWFHQTWLIKLKHLSDLILSDMTATFIGFLIWVYQISLLKPKHFQTWFYQTCLLKLNYFSNLISSNLATGTQVIFWFNFISLEYLRYQSWMKHLSDLLLWDLNAQISLDCSSNSSICLVWSYQTWLLAFLQFSDWSLSDFITRIQVFVWFEFIRFDRINSKKKIWFHI